jgi:hypothetical protein
MLLRMTGGFFRCEACAFEFQSEVARCPRCLKQSSVVPAVPGAPGAKRTRTPADKHIEVNAVLQTVLVGLHVWFTLSSAINLGLTLSEAGQAGHPLAGLYPTYDSEVERTAALVTYAWIGAWSVLGLFWTPINAWGLWKRRPWARATTIAYYVASILGCCCLPLGIYGLWSMGRRDVGDRLRGDSK